MPTPTHGVQNIRAISIEVENKIASRDDAYQLVLTHTFESVTPMALGGYLLDFYEIDHINLDADYWNRGAVDSMAVDGDVDFSKYSICRFGFSHSGAYAATGFFQTRGVSDLLVDLDSVDFSAKADLTAENI